MSHCEERFASNLEDYPTFTTERLRREFVIRNLFNADAINWTYSHYDRIMISGIQPQNKSLQLECADQLKADYFLQRREMGIFNVGGEGIVVADGNEIELSYKQAVYIGRGTQNVSFLSQNTDKPAKFYCLSTPAHQSCPIQKITKNNADILNLGSKAEANERCINKMLVSPVIETCQLQMGMTELVEGSVWNTMPPHTHSRRMEVYFYFEVKENQAVCHFMGPKNETRPLWLNNNEAAISPPWSIHCGVGTQNYTFIWGMAGENLDYDDMDKFTAAHLK